MNLTLKQLFKFGAACTCACALVATAATDYVADSFEVSDGGSEGLAIAEYKQVIDYSGTDQVTNYVWYAESGDATAIVTNDAAYAAYTGISPMTNATKALVLNLETEGNTLSRTAGVSFASAPVYVDTLVKFTPSEDDPTIDTGTGSDVKVALWVNAQSNVVVTHAYQITDGAYETYPTNSVLEDVTIAPDKWYRLTMKLKYGTGDLAGFNTAQIWLDGSQLSHANALKPDIVWNGEVPSFQNGGSYFQCIDRAGGTMDSLNKISFQGTGMLDELVVTDTAPEQSESSAIMLTLAYSGPGSVTFTVDGQPATEVETGVEVKMAANDWYQMGTATSDAEGFVVSNAIGAAENQIQTRTVRFDATSAGTVTVPTALMAGDYDIGGGLSIDLGSLAAWAQPKGYDQADVEANAESYLDAYVLGVTTDVAADAKLVITSIDVGATDTTITVEAIDDGDAVKFNALNGEVTVWSSDDLATAFSLDATFNVTASSETAATVVIPNAGSGMFIKAKVELVTTPTAE